MFATSPDLRQFRECVALACLGSLALLLSACGSGLEVGIPVADSARAKPDDGDSWWAEDGDGNAQAVRVLNFYDKSELLRDLTSSLKCTIR